MKLVTIFDSGLKPNTSKDGSVVMGIVIGAGLNLLYVGLATLIGDQLDTDLLITVVSLGGVGLIQLIYVVPLYFYLKRKEKTETAKGLAIAASLVILISAIWWGGFLLGK